MLGVPFLTAFWLWILPLALMVAQFGYCLFEEKKSTVSPRRGED